MWDSLPLKNLVFGDTSELFFTILQGGVAYRGLSAPILYLLAFIARRGGFPTLDREGDLAPGRGFQKVSATFLERSSSCTQLA